ncbi:hypothetical protein [Maledivibacter halophilus]|uniref:Uncharacterized protein n=1 Tax=Maledivibacter halophilus TaxID=36842 RepID=A0A1T5LDH9_9FIRM|nr:hypothetical protein [Maledivibacter halophilus]SKC73914.1 hypothetical protein SAMN02194393_02788 [Maledivibacter halophilus]
MGKKYKYDFYFKIENESKSDEKSLNDYATLSLERYLPLDKEEYENAAEKLVESVSNSTGINKKYITAISKEEFMKK